MSGPVLYTECAVELLYSIVPPLNEAGLEKQKRLFSVGSSQGPVLRPSWRWTEKREEAMLFVEGLALSM